MEFFITFCIIQFVAAVFVLALISESKKTNKYPVKDTFIACIVPGIGAFIMLLIILDLVKED